MVNPSINGMIEPEASVQPMIDCYSSMEEVLAWKMPGAGGGGYLALVVRTVSNLQRIMTKPSIFRYEGHNYLVPFLIINSLFFMWGFAHGILEVLNPHFQESFHISKAMSAPDAGCCLWCLLSDGAACRMDYPEVGLQKE